MKNIFMRTLALCLIAFALVGVLAISASAAEFASSSTMVMVDPNTKKTASTFYLYGRADYICLKMNNDRSDQGADRPTFELYSDSAYKNKIASYQSGDPSEKTAYITLSLDLSNVKSGTYYAKTYIKKDDYSGFSIDKSTIKTYKIVIKKGGTTMTDMNTVMYGYENTENGPKIYWFGVPDATGYYVYRRNPDTKKYEKIKTVKDNGKKLVSCTDTSRKNKNSTDYYRVVAYKGSKKTPSSLKSMKVTVLKTPIITIEPLADNEVKISWSAVKSGAKYTLLMRTKDSDWQEVRTTKYRSTLMEFDEYESNKAYYFTVIANVNDIYSGYNVNGKAFKYLEAPKLKPCTYPDDGGITVNWDSVEGADQYAIYKKNNTQWNRIALVEGTETSYTDLTTEAINGGKYTVRSIVNGAYKSYRSYGVNGVKLQKITIDEVVESDGKLQLSWTNPLEAQACSYEVYYKVNGGASKYFTTTTANSCLFAPTRDIITYEFNVHAVKNNVVGPDNESGYLYTYYPKMYSPTVIADENSAIISWDGISAAEGYALYKKTGDGEYELLTQTTEKSYVDNDVLNDVSYSYKIAYIYDGRIVSERESSGVTRTFIDESVSIASDYITPEYKKYWVPIENYEAADCQYILYEKINGKWTVNYDGYVNSSGEMQVYGSSGVRELAIVKKYSDARTTRLPENGFIVDFEGCAKDVSFYREGNVATFAWSPVSLDADNVIIYKNDQYLATVPKEDGKFTDDNIEPNINTVYRILTQKGSFVSYKNVEKECAYLVTPNFTLTSSKGYVRIAWDKVEADCSIVIFRKKGTEFQEIKSCYSDGWCYTKDYHVKSGSTYRYVVALKDSEGNITPYDPNGKTIKYLDAPGITSAKSYKNGVRVAWQEVGKAEGYVVSYKENGIWKVLANLAADKLSYIDTTVSTGEKRTYMVYAYSGNYKSYQSSKTTYYLERPSIKSISSTTKQVKINFNPVKGATKYKIYCKKGSDDTWYSIGTTTKTSYTYKTQRPNLKYTFAVTAILEKGSTNYTSDKSPSKTAKNLATPKLDTISSTKSGIKLTWSVVPYSTGYNIYRKNSDGEFEKIAYVKGNESVSYVDKTAKKGKTYTYTVRATYGNCLSSYNKTGLTCKDKY